MPPGPDPFGPDRSQQLFGLKSRSWAFGELTFVTQDEKPQVVFQLIDADGKEVEKVTI